MPAGYTQSIEDAYWSYTDRIAGETRERIENIDENATAEEWRRELNAIGQEQTSSARFFLMSWLQENASAVEGDQFVFSYQGRDHRFHRVSRDYALSLPEQERNDYIRLLTRIAADNHGEEPRLWKPLFWRAMLRSKSTRLLSREEGFQIAHGLHFSLLQAEKFLICVLENDGLSYIRSEDLIEAFCFLHLPANNARVARNLKERCEARCGAIPKNDSQLRPDAYTQSISLSLPGLLRSWNQDADHDTVEQFLDWLETQAPNLDVPGKSARSIYSRLAHYAWQLTAHPDLFPSDAYFTAQIEERCFGPLPASASDVDPYVVAQTILNRASTEFDNERKRNPELIWRCLTVDESGKLTAQAIGDRIPHLLRGELSVTKADLLFLLWYTCDRLWLEATDDESLYDRLCGFWMLSDELLEEALLPRFYVPHVLERSFLEAICSKNTLIHSPFEVYESMCESVLPEKRTRSRQKTADAKSTRLRRAQMEQETEAAYCSGQLDHEGLDEALAPHLLRHARPGAQYQFTPDGVTAPPNPEVIVPYPHRSSAERFRQSAPDYKSDERAQERFRFLYGLSLALCDRAAREGFHCGFRVNYTKNATLTLLEWERL